MSKRNTDDENIDEHLANVEEGAGCVEVWETLSEQRQEASSAED